MKVIKSISVLPEQIKMVAEEQAKQGCSFSEVVRRALSVYFAKPNQLPERYKKN